MRNNTRFFDIQPVKKAAPPSEKKPFKLLQKAWFRPVAVVVIILIAAAIVGIVTLSKNHTHSNGSKDQVADITTQVGKLMLLPSGEQPTLATISDVSKFKGQAFFEHAQNGDKILVYPQARKAILYRPTINKIIEVAPLNGNNPQSTDTTAQ